MPRPYEDYPTMCVTGSINRLMEDDKYGDLTPEKVARLRQLRAELELRIDRVVINPNCSGQQRPE